MASDKHKSDRDYNRGYHDGLKNDYKTPSTADIIIGAVVPGVDPAGPSKDYNEGYKDGKEDRSR